MMTTSFETTRTRGQEPWLVRHGMWVVLGLAALVRGAALTLLPSVIGTDGARYMLRAAQLSAGKWETAFVNVDFNLFPIGIAWLHDLLALGVPVSFEQAGMLLNVSAGLLLIYPLYRITRRLYGGIAAVTAGVYLACLPELIGVTCAFVREAPYLCVLAWAYYYVISALDNPDDRAWRLGRLLAAGALFMVAALLRLEALGVFACAAGVVCVAHAPAGWRFKRRLKALAALCVLVPVVALAVGGYARVRSGQWQFARMDKIHKGYSLGSRGTVLEDSFYISKADAYGADGRVDVDALVRINFFKMAKRNREIICVAEITTGLTRMLQAAGVLLLAGALWRARRAPWRAWLQPVPVFALLAVLLFGAVFMRYVMNNFIFSPRYGLTLIVVLAAPAGAGILALDELRGRARLLIWPALAGLLIWLLIEAFQPKNARRLPMKTAGIALRTILPPDAVIVAPPQLMEVTYYAQRPMMMMPAQDLETLPASLRATNGYVLLNVREQWQAQNYATITSGLRRIDVTLPANNKYEFSLYTVDRQQP